MENLLFLGVPILKHIRVCKLAFSYVSAEKISCSAELNMKKFYDLGTKCFWKDFVAQGRKQEVTKVVFL